MCIVSGYLKRVSVFGCVVVPVLSNWWSCQTDECQTPTHTYLCSDYQIIVLKIIKIERFFKLETVQRKTPAIVSLVDSFNHSIQFSSIHIHLYSTSRAAFISSGRMAVEWRIHNSKLVLLKRCFSMVRSFYAGLVQMVTSQRSKEERFSAFGVRCCFVEAEQ